MVLELNKSLKSAESIVSLHTRLLGPSNNFRPFQRCILHSLCVVNIPREDHLPLTCPYSTVFRDALGCRNRVNSEVQLGARIKWTQTCNMMPWLTEFGDELGGWDRVNWEMHLEVAIEQVWGFTRRTWLSEIWGEHGCGRWVVCRELSLYSSGCYSNFQLSECDEVTSLLSAGGELAGGGPSWKEAHQKLKLYSVVNSQSCEWR